MVMLEQTRSRLDEVVEPDVGTEWYLRKQADRPNGSLDGAVAVVTGVPCMTGAAIVNELGTAGAVVLLGRTAGFSTGGLSLKSICCTVAPDDRASESSAHDAVGSGVRMLIESIVQSHGHLDILINMITLTVASATAKRHEDWNLDVTADLEHCLVPIMAAMPIFRAQSRGTIVNVAAFAGAPGEVNRERYALTSRNLTIFTAQLAEKLSADHVTANSIFPGFIEPSLSVETPAVPSDMIPAEIAVSDKVARCVHFLSGNSRNVAGKTITIGGGCYL